MVAAPIDELIDMQALDSTGEIIEKVLYGSIEEKVDALVTFNEVITINLSENKESLIKNAEFICRTFADVLDGIYYRYRDDFPTKFVDYLVKVFKKCFCIGFITQNISEPELRILVEVILLKLLPDNTKIIKDFSVSQELTKELNAIVIHIIEYSDSSTCFYTFLTLSEKYDSVADKSKMPQILAK